MFQLNQCPYFVFQLPGLIVHYKQSVSTHHVLLQNYHQHLCHRICRHHQNKNTCHPQNMCHVISGQAKARTQRELYNFCEKEKYLRRLLHRMRNVQIVCSECRLQNKVSRHFRNLLLY